jgi:hypothetical protein
MKTRTAVVVTQANLGGGRTLRFLWRGYGGEVVVGVVVAGVVVLLGEVTNIN